LFVEEQGRLIWHGLKSPADMTQVKKIVSGKLIDLNSSGSITIMADAGIHDGAGTTRTITALEHIELKCGQASIKLSKDGTVTIKGTKIDMN